MNCAHCHQPNPRYRAPATGLPFCSAPCFIGFRTQVPGDLRFDYIVERSQRKQLLRTAKPNTTILKHVVGPSAVLYFNVDGHDFFLFGEQHKDSPIVPEDKEPLDVVINNSEPLQVTGTTLEDWTIERLCTAWVLHALHSNLNVDFYLESVYLNSSEPRKFYYLPNRPQKTKRLERLDALFENEYIRPSINNQVRAHRIDYKMHEEGYGVGLEFGQTVCPFSLYYILEKDADENALLRHELEDIFNPPNNRNAFDVLDLVRVTLFNERLDLFGSFRDYVTHIHEKLTLYAPYNPWLKHYRDLPGFTRLDVSCTADGNSIQSSYYLRAPDHIQRAIRACCLDQPKSLNEMYQWCMDAPAFAQMLQETRNTAIAYMGLDHLSNMMKILARLGVPFDHMYGKMQKQRVDLSLHMRETIRIRYVPFQDEPVTM